MRTLLRMQSTMWRASTTHVTCWTRFALCVAQLPRLSFCWQTKRIWITTDKSVPPVCTIISFLTLFYPSKVSVEDGQEISLQYQCQFNEVSAAESYISISLAFQNLIKQTQPILRSVPFARRKTSPSMAVSRMIGLVFGKGYRVTGKKRPSLSIWDSAFGMRVLYWSMIINKNVMLSELGRSKR